MPGLFQLDASTVIDDGTETLIMAARKGYDEEYIPRMVARNAKNGEHVLMLYAMGDDGHLLAVNSVSGERWPLDYSELQPPDLQLHCVDGRVLAIVGRGLTATVDRVLNWSRILHCGGWTFSESDDGTQYLTQYSHHGEALKTPKVNRVDEGTTAFSKELSREYTDYLC